MSDDQRRLTQSGRRKHLEPFLIERQLGPEIPAAVTSCVLFDSGQGALRKEECERLSCYNEEDF